ncbi:TetR/AcrR family transcriptional regulator [Microbacterium sp. 22303]|uniref:TetR/AcrR family transcriptional regulator n=1 Tax=Microbacterium sp. 22303 TaxID=3453905 RepID=UPI003F858BD5
MPLYDLLDDPSFRYGAYKQATQQRSRERLSRVLDVTRNLLINEGLQSVNTTRVAAEAGVSVGWMYTFFENRETLLEEILVGCLRGLDHAMADAGLDLSDEQWRTRADAGTAACIEYFAHDHAFRGLWFAEEFSGRMLQVNRMHDDLMAAWLASTMPPFRPDAPPVDPLTVAEIFVGMLDKGVDLAFRRDPNRIDPAVAAEVRRSAVAYLDQYLP